ncbi:MAG: hypothetical protein P4L53_06745 [Candidatus Obscuribacterales bacterium]|nr:hypothetical protein [Candidatus Obscuribacterales bacterium]
MTDDEIVNSVEKSLRELALGDIKRAVEGKALVGAFILCCCLLDSLTGFCYRCETTADTFDQFCKRYLLKVNKSYEGARLWKALRCGLIHNYSSAFESTGKMWRIELVNGRENIHLERAQEADSNATSIFLNLESFVDDVEKVLENFFVSVRDPKDQYRTKLNLIAFARVNGWMEIFEENSGARSNNQLQNTMLLSSTGQNSPHADTPATQSASLTKGALKIEPVVIQPGVGYKLPKEE